MSDFEVPSAIARVTCPFPPCGGWPHILPYQPHALIESHQMFNYINGSPEGTSCPASLMRWPLTATGMRVLDEQEKAWEPHIEAWRGPEHPRWATGDPAPLPPSQSLRGPHRMGREPPNGSKAWVLGGRKDEDVIPQEEERRGTVPQGVVGESIGGTGMLSELAGLINAAGANGSEARAAIGGAIEALERAKGAISEALGSGSSDTLNDYLTFLNRAITECQDVQGQIDAGHDKGQEYIGRLSGA
jgi:hypothetical protein